MDQSKRQITRIAREINSYTASMLKDEHLGSAEYEMLHLLRHSPGISQKQATERLNLDKGACARRAMALEEKGYVKRVMNPEDHRSVLLYATQQAEEMKADKTELESEAYEWLLNEFSEEERNTFCELLDRLYVRSKKEARAGFPNYKKARKRK